MPTRNKYTWIDDEKERPPWSKKTPKKNTPKQLQTHNVLGDGVENTNGTN